MIRIIPNIPEAYNEEGEVISFLEGFHVNTDFELPNAEDYKVVPEVPFQVFARPLPTFCYRFASEAEALVFIGDYLDE